MRKSLIVLAVLATVGALQGCATTQAQPAQPMAMGGGANLHVPAARMAECERQGGCGLVSVAEVQGALEEAYAMGLAAAQQTCRRDRAL